MITIFRICIWTITCKFDTIRQVELAAAIVIVILALWWHHFCNYGRLISISVYALFPYVFGDMLSCKVRASRTTVITSFLSGKAKNFVNACLENQVEYKEAEGSSYQEGSYSETPGTPPKTIRITPSLIRMH